MKWKQTSGFSPQFFLWPSFIWERKDMLLHEIIKICCNQGESPLKSNGQGGDVVVGQEFAGAIAMYFVVFFFWWKKVNL